MLEGLFGQTNRYEKQVQTYLEDARLSALEHEVAAEHHYALAQMYRERVARLEQKVKMADISSNDVRVEPRITAVK